MGEANGGGGGFGGGGGRARRWRYRALPLRHRAASTPSSPAHAAFRYPSEADLRSRSRDILNQILVRMWFKSSTLIQFTPPIPPHPAPLSPPRPLPPHPAPPPPQPTPRP